MAVFAKIFVIHVFTWAVRSVALQARGAIPTVARDDRHIHRSDRSPHRFFRHARDPSIDQSAYRDPGRRQRVAAWVGLLASVAIVFGAGWSLVTGGPIGPLLLPMSNALANFAVLIPMRQARRLRHRIVSETAATLVCQHPVQPG